MTEEKIGCIALGVNGTAAEKKNSQEAEQAQAAEEQAKSRAARGQVQKKSACKPLQISR